MSALDHLSDLLAGASRVLEQHLKLARLELRADAREIGTRLALIVALLVPVLVGYGFLCAGAALYLSRHLSSEAAFALVGTVNLAGAAVGIAIAGRQLAARPLLQATLDELEATSVAVRGGEPPGPGSGGGR